MAPLAGCSELYLSTVGAESDVMEFRYGNLSLCFMINIAQTLAKEVIFSRIAPSIYPFKR